MEWITFKDGLYGFPKLTEFQLQPAGDLKFLTARDGVHRFVLTDPTLYVPSCHFDLHREDVYEVLGTTAVETANVYAIVNRQRNGDLTLNLLGPVIIHPHTHRGGQLIQRIQGCSTRHIIGKGGPQ